MVKRIIGGVVTLVIGGTTLAVSQKDITSNFSQNTGMSQQQAQQYIDNIPKSDLASFSEVGQGFVDDGNKVLAALPGIDCTNYSYPWETPTLGCSDGVAQLKTVGNEEITMGSCLQSLDTDLGNTAKDKITECIADIDATDTAYNLPIVSALLDSDTISHARNTDAYNKSVLQAALNAT